MMMKRILIATALAFASVSHAENGDWARKLQDYKGQVQRSSNVRLLVHNAFYTAGAVASCSMSAAVVGAAFVSDTAPGTNLLAETIANAAVPDYKTYEAMLSWETLAQMGRGMIGGGPIAMVESLQFVVLWLGGKESQSFEQVKQVYASTVRTAETVLGRDGQCFLNLSRVLLARREMQARGMLPAGKPVPALVPDHNTTQMPAPTAP